MLVSQRKVLFSLFSNFTQLNRKVNNLSHFARGALGLLFGLLATAPVLAERSTVSLAYRVAAQYPHDPDHFTQGLYWDGEWLWESTGGYGRSAVYRKRLEDGQSLARWPLPASLFGEGLAPDPSGLRVLSWREQRGFVLNRALEPSGEFRYEGEGWGLSAGQYAEQPVWFMSDGSAQLQVRSGPDFSLLRRVLVRNGRGPVSGLNELEWIEGRVWANVWQTDRIVVIDPLSGWVEAELDLSALHLRLRKSPGWDPRDNVLNGIAYDAQRRRLLVTGKRWPQLFELELPVWPAATR